MSNWHFQVGLRWPDSESVSVTPEEVVPQGSLPLGVPKLVRPFPVSLRLFRQSRKGAGWKLWSMQQQYFLANRNTYFLISLRSKAYDIKVYSGSLKARVICLKGKRL